MATDRLATVLKSRSDFSDEEIARMTEDDAWHWIRANASAPERTEEEAAGFDHS